MFSYLRLLAIAIFIIAVSMSNQRVDALALPAPALIPRRNHDSSPPTPSVAAFAGPGGNAEGGSVSQSNEGSTLPINVLSNNAGNGGDASSKSGISVDTPSSKCDSCESCQQKQHSPHPASTNDFSATGGQAKGGSVYRGAERDHRLSSPLVDLDHLDIGHGGDGVLGL